VTSPTCSVTVTASTLEAWAAQAENSPVSELGGFAKGLRKDWAAVTAAD
jgi:hypothetical protein